MLKKDADGLYSSGRIRKDKLNADLNLGEIGNKSYVQTAEEIARSVYGGGKVNMCKLAKVRINTENDSGTLKGDFVVALYV